MNTLADKIHKKQNKVLSNRLSQKELCRNSTLELPDNRTDAATQSKLQECANKSPKVKQLNAVEEMANSDNRQAMTAPESLKMVQQSASQTGSFVQRKSIPGVAGYGNFIDLGNGKFGTTQPTDADEVAGLVNEIRTRAAQAGVHQNIKVLTGTHGDRQGNLYGEEQFYNEDLAHEGHKIPAGGWINILQVRGKTKETIARWKEPGTSAVILAWCYSKKSDENWDNVQADWANFS